MEVQGHIGSPRQPSEREYQKGVNKYKLTHDEGSSLGDVLALRCEFAHMLLSVEVRRWPQSKSEVSSTPNHPQEKVDTCTFVNLQGCMPYFLLAC